VETKVETQTKEEHSLECLVYFGQGKTIVSPAQLPNVERIATFLKNNKDSKVIIYGYASPEGSVEVNERIANQRADAVKNLLVNKYKIAADRITAKGKGVGDSFSEPDWNRVSICTIER
jgi:outer membrane protein OmpA-like peptidoglycan-associated protein